MPICTREGFETSSKNQNETFNDSELVFYCETTKQIFRDYEDYFRHVMLINSTIWQCEETGKENLTYAEALYNERKARKKIETFKEILRAPTLIAIGRASQSSFKEINNIVYTLIRDRFFKGEIIQACLTSSTNSFHECRILEVIKPSEARDDQVVDPNKVKYKLQKLTGIQTEATFVVPPQNIKRSRSDFSQNNLQLFIKDSVHRVQGIIKPKPEQLQKYVLDKNIEWATLFCGAMPAWTPAKPKKDPPPKKENKLKKEEDAGNAGNKSKKQASMSQYVVREEESSVDKLKREQSLKEQMERVRKEKEEKAAELERKRLEILTKIEVDLKRILIKTDDLERIDQKLMPLFHPVNSIIPFKYFGDFIYVQEFLHSFVGILTGHEAFKPHITFYEMTRAFTCREVAGPLSDILICLLGTIFALQGEEEEEQSVEYIRPRVQLETEPYITIRHATETHIYVRRHFSQKLNDLPLDAQTLSEVLRLHLLSSGASTDEKSDRWRYMYRNGYNVTEDPGFELRMAQPHIIRALRSYTVYQLPFLDITKILNCLIAQIVTYSTSLNVIDERSDNVIKARSKIRLIIMNENKRINTITNEKKKLQQEFYLKCFEEKDNPEFKDDPEKKKSMEEKLKKQFEIIDAKGVRDKSKFDNELEKEYESIFNFMVYLGMDRAYRKYYVFESIAGIFIEHPPECDDYCMKDPPKNWFEISNIPKNRRELRNFLTQFYSKQDKIKKENEKLNKQNTPITTTDLEADKENLENLPNGKIYSLLNGDIKSSSSTSTTPLLNGDIKTELIDEEKKLPSQYELYMCTGNPKNCIVHDEKNPERVRWSYIYTEEEFDALIYSLNQFGDRESQLKEQLSTYRSFLVKHAKLCPIEYLHSNEDKARSYQFKKLMMTETSRKYSNPNFGFTEDSDINLIMFSSCAERILQLEIDITSGSLGKMKVNDIIEWRKNLIDNKYDPQTELHWGVENYTGKKSDDPGDCLGDTMDIESEDSSDEGIINYESPELKSMVKNLASGLLQIGQSIEPKFLKEPFGLQKEIRDKDERKIQLDKANLKHKHWEMSLMNASSYSSVFLHLNILNDSIKWNRSTNRSKCIICHRSSDPEKLLLCDECNAGTHMFCLKPVLKKIPEDNWYCKRCVAQYGYENSVVEKTKGRRKQFLPQEEDDDDTKSVSSKGSIKKKGRNGEQNEPDSDEDQFFVPKDEKKQKKIDQLFKKSKKHIPAPKSESEPEEEIDENDDDLENISEASEGNDEEKVEEGEDEEDDDDAVQDDESANMSEESEAEKESEEEASPESEEDDEACNVCSYTGIELTCGGCSSKYHLDCVNLKRTPRTPWKCTKCKAKEEKKNKAQKIVHKSSDDSDDEKPLVKRQKRNSNNTGTQNKRSSNRNSKQHEIDDGPKYNSNNRRSRRTGDDLPLNGVVLYDLLDDISKNENSWPFLRPVLQSEVPDYYDIIKRPMDFAKIKSKLNMGQYRINEEVLNDIQLVFKNCDAYNSEGNEIYVAGASLEKFIMEKCNELNLPFRPSDMNSS